MATSSVPTDLSAEDLERLRYKPQPPVSFEPPPPGASTRVVGYFNPNPWQVHIALSIVGVSVTLNNRYQFLVLENGQKINDPLLDQFVGAGMLAREISQVDVPFVLFPARQQRPTNETRYGFAGTQNVRHTAAGQPIMPTSVPGTAPTPSAGVSPVGAMSIEQARKLKLIRQPTLVNIDAGIEDSEGIVDASRAPTLEVPVDRPPRRSVVADEGVNLNQPENLQQQQTIRTLQESANYDPTDIKGIMHNAVASVPGGIEALGEPNLDELEEEPNVAGTPAGLPGSFSAPIVPPVPVVASAAPPVAAAPPVVIPPVVAKTASPAKKKRAARRPLL